MRTKRPTNAAPTTDPDCTLRTSERFRFFLRMGSLLAHTEEEEEEEEEGDDDEEDDEEEDEEPTPFGVRCSSQKP